MIPRQYLGIPVLALASTLLTSFTFPAPERGPALSTESSMRVSRHFAAGLEYLVVEPPDLPEDAELPMVVYLHGRGDVPRAPGGPLYGLETPIRVIIPRGPERFGDGYAWAPVSAHRGESPPLVEALRSRGRLLAEAMVEWRRRHPTRGRPVVTGFSQGGMLTLTLAVHHPESIAHAFPIAGWLPPSLEPGAYDPYAPHAPVVALHGEADEVLSAGRTRGLMERLSRMGYPVAFETYDGVGHEKVPAMRARMRELLERALRELPEASHAAGSS
jgi:phospholipase/carboxylesterase